MTFLLMPGPCRTICEVLSWPSRAAREEIVRFSYLFRPSVQYQPPPSNCIYNDKHGALDGHGMKDTVGFVFRVHMMRLSK